jgi:hypothetical protein
MDANAIMDCCAPISRIILGAPDPMEHRLAAPGRLGFGIGFFMPEE